MNILINWKTMTRLNEDYCRVLYANIDCENNEIVYIGKADFLSVKKRINGKDKTSLYNFLRENGTNKIKTIIGDIVLEEGKKLSQELLSDIESLLIKRINPIGNIQSQKTRISRPGMHIFCKGAAWPDAKSAFFDKG